MSEFDDLLEEYLGEGDALTDIRACVRNLWFYDFDGYPVRVWDGQGKLHTTDGNQWLGTIDGTGKNHHITPTIQDGRDGSSASYTTSISLFGVGDETPSQLYEEIKAEQSLAVGRKVTTYFAIFKEEEALRPLTPISFNKEFLIKSVQFSEKLESASDGVLVRKYIVSANIKDNNFGRANVPNGTYADAIQKERARQLGVPLDRGSEFLALLANRTYQIP